MTAQVAQLEEDPGIVNSIGSSHSKNPVLRSKTGTAQLHSTTQGFIGCPLLFFLV